MASWNQWTGIGNCTRDIEVRYLQSGTAVASGGIACNRKYKTAGGEEREEVLFLDFDCFGKGGETLAQYAGKGKQLFLAGRLVTESWEDKQSGQKRSKTKLQVETFQFLGGREGGGNGDGEQRQQRRPAPASAPDGDDTPFKEDDIPF